MNALPSNHGSRRCLFRMAQAAITLPIISSFRSYLIPSTRLPTGIKSISPSNFRFLRNNSTRIFTSSSRSGNLPSTFTKDNSLHSADSSRDEEDDDANFSSSVIEFDDYRVERQAALHKYLTEVGIDANDLADAAMRSITSTDGYDPKYGKSAIRAYRAYMNPKQKRKKKSNTKLKKQTYDEDVNGVSLRIETVAASIARQIEFLAKRNRSHQAEWVRHTDVDFADNDEKKKKTFPLIIVLDNVRSAFNVGSIFRTADACNCRMIITTGITPHPNGSGMEKLQKCALGADQIVSSKHFGRTVEAIEFLRKTHPRWMIAGLETTEGSVSYTDVIYPGGEEDDDQYMGNDRHTDKKMKKHNTRGTVLVLGNEVTGVDTEIMEDLDLIVEIPMFGTKNSLNIAACAPVVMYEILRQWGK